MHKNNKLWLTDLKICYPSSFVNCKVLELGSYNENGSVREFFENGDYVGVDKRNGAGVDICCNAQLTIFELESFDTIISFSMLEHDSNWKDSLSHNLQFLKQKGMIFISFGAEGNLEHGEDWKPVPSKEFLQWVNQCGLELISAFYEESRYGPDCKGAFNAILRKP